MDYRRLCACRGKRSLNEMLNCFEMFLPIVRRNLELLEELAYDFVKRQREQNIIYTEVRYSPRLLCEGYSDQEEGRHRDDHHPETVIDSKTILNVVTRGLRRGCSDFNVTVNQILCAITWEPNWATEVVELANEYKNNHPCAVVGIDIAAGEEHFNRVEFPILHDAHYEMMLMAKRYNIDNITIHAGETTNGLQNVQDAIRKYGAKRIGHGYRMVDSKRVMELVKKNNIHVEVCPTSSLETGGWIYDKDNNNHNDKCNDQKNDNNNNNNNNNNERRCTTLKRNWKRHPCVRMLQENISFSLSSDDPAVFYTSLAWQYRIALNKMEFTKEQILQTITNSISAAFCSEKEKDRLRKIIDHFGKNHYHDNRNHDYNGDDKLSSSSSQSNRNVTTDTVVTTTNNNNNNNNTSTTGKKKSYRFNDRVYDEIL